MNPDRYSFHFHQSSIQVTRYGDRGPLLILFHGFSEAGKMYDQLGKMLAPHLTLVIPDMPFHGKTQWREGLLTPELLEELVVLLLQKEGKTRCSIMGYSMGGRPAQCLIQENPGFVDQLLLVAPEGLRKNRWFQFSTGARLGQFIFRWVTFKPGILFFLLKMGRFLGVMSEKKVHFIKDHTINKEKRLRVYRLWMCFRKLRTNRKRLYSVIQKENLPVWICFGKYDRLVPAETAKKIKPLPQIKVAVAESGHQLLLQPHVLQELLNWLCASAKT